ncbi:hypothetical protein ACEPAG_2654 [Sanghuangporus baumii]
MVMSPKTFTHKPQKYQQDVSQVVKFWTSCSTAEAGAEYMAWGLVQLLMSTLAQSILRDSTLFNRLAIVREWLHVAHLCRFLPNELRAIGRKFTRLRLQQAERTDAFKQREYWKFLSADDVNYEKALAQALYGYARAGKINEAVDLCRRAKRSWPWPTSRIRASLCLSSGMRLLRPEGWYT